MSLATPEIIWQPKILSFVTLWAIRLATLFAILSTILFWLGVSWTPYLAIWMIAPLLIHWSCFPQFHLFVLSSSSISFVHFSTTIHNILTGWKISICCFFMLCNRFYILHAVRSTTNPSNGQLYHKLKHNQRIRLENKGFKWENGLFHYELIVPDFFTHEFLNLAKNDMNNTKMFYSLMN